ncbi:ABC transporter permease [Gulosibacter sp. ACHW.36C]|uniref:ABC transporter permease n=1 Tax=Gulosibacter sediminis TaxID=1729695 RepID=A0ABY4MXK6_9MICO|nr:ABC transporter permease [Gulosibacter sediminis]UQN15168.1 ABC transporter permease [Gulosibacter sediminis]
MTDTQPKYTPAVDAGGTEAILTTKADRRQLKREGGRPSLFTLLLRDKFATTAAVVLIVIILTSLVAPLLVSDLAQRPDLPNRNLPPFSIGEGWQFILGSDAIGRSMLARMMIAGGTSLGVSLAAVVVAGIIGTAWGIWAGYHRGWRESLSMRIGDIIMSFPSLLLAVVILYIFAPSAANIVLVLALTRIPIYLRTARAETAELRTRMFVDAARNFGASPATIMGRHIFPNVLPTIVSLATLEFCYVMLAESSLSFLGIGIQPPDLSWGLMVSQGREYLSIAWWQSVLPGLSIVITTVCANVLAAWLRIATDPGQRWRLANKK